MAGNAIDELINTLYELVDEAMAVPLSDKCIVERGKVLDMLEEIRANLPSDLKMAREIVEKRNEVITAGKREYDTKIKQAEELAKQKVNEHDIVVEARKRAAEIVETAENRSKELMKAASSYCDDAMKRTEASIDETLDQIKNTRVQLGAAMKDYK